MTHTINDEITAMIAPTPIDARFPANISKSPDKVYVSVEIDVHDLIAYPR
jgi:hypothetical protein